MCRKIFKGVSMSNNTVKGYIFAILSAVIYGCMPLMASYIYADGVNPFTLVFLRNCFSIPVLGFIAYMKKGSLKIPVKMLPRISLIAVLGCCMTPILLFSSYRFIPSEYENKKGVIFCIFAENKHLFSFKFILKSNLL